MKKYFINIHVVLPLMLGILIYCCYRSKQLWWWVYLEKSSLLPYGNYLREHTVIQNSKNYLPDWLLFSLPDALWLYALVCAILYLWDFKWHKHSAIWIIGAASLGIFLELGQLINCLSGTFDWIDILCYILAAGIPLYCFLRY